MFPKHGEGGKTEETKTRVAGGISRRGFVADAGALGLAGACAGMASASGWLAPRADADEAGGERVACTYHHSHCGNMCALRCTVRDGRLVYIEPNYAMAERRYSTLCLKGISEVQHIYSNKRIQTPLKRAGERGANEFEPVSWDEALDDIVEQIKDIQAKHGTDSALVTTCAEADMPFLSTILQARTPANNNGIDIGTGNGLDPATGWGWGYAMSASEPGDWVNSRLVLHVGTNSCESSLTNARVMFDAIDVGARVVTIDPHFSTTACHCSARRNLARWAFMHHLGCLAGRKDGHDGYDSKVEQVRGGSGLLRHLAADAHERGEFCGHRSGVLGGVSRFRKR